MSHQTANESRPSAPHRAMKYRYHLSTLAVCIAVLAACGGTDPAPEPVSIKLIALNDFHGNIELTSSTNGGQVTLPDGASGTKVDVGGAAYLSTLVKQLKAKNPNNIVVGAGDLIGASPFTSAITHDEATVDILNQIGIEVTSVGNHEFDRGLTELRRLQSGGCYPASSGQGVVGVDTCLQNGTFPGASYKYLAANTVSSNGTTLFDATFVKKFGRVSVGFVGLTTKDTAGLVSADAYAGYTFADEATTINKYANQLKANGSQAVVVLIHQGGQTTATSINDKTCPGFVGDIKPILDKLNANVDVVVSGHTHQEYACNYQSAASGKNLLVTSTGFYGANVSEIDLLVSPFGGVISATANTVPVIRDTNTATLPNGFSKLAKDATVDAAVTRYTNLAKQAGNVAVGSIGADIKRALLSNGTRDETNESPLANVMADSYLGGVPGSADFAFVNPGSVRADLIFGDGNPNGTVTYSMLATIEPFGNTLVTVNLTGAQVLRLLEQQWEGANATAKTNATTNTVGRILGISKGLTYTYDNNAPKGAATGSGARVVAGSVKLNGVAIDPAQTYKVVTNSFLSPSLVSSAAPDNFSAIMNGGTNRVDTKILDLDAFIAFFKLPANANLPAPAQRVVRLN